MPAASKRPPNLVMTALLVISTGFVQPRKRILEQFQMQRYPSFLCSHQDQRNTCC